MCIGIIQQAIGVIDSPRSTADRSYATLRSRAVGNGTSLLDTVHAVITEQR